MTTFGTIAKRWRGERTQIEASALIGITQGSLSRLETDDRRPSLSLFVRIAEAYGVADEEISGALRVLGEMDTLEEEP
jgi:transcriptional regulator with XRE-family HTH domain